jgi:hypothetical protein
MPLAAFGRGERVQAGSSEGCWANFAKAFDYDAIRRAARTGGNDGGRRTPRQPYRSVSEQMYRVVPAQ